MHEKMQEVMDNMTPEYLSLAEDNQFVYLFSKAFLFLKMGPEAYRNQDFFNQPSEDIDAEELELINNGCRQILAGRGFSTDQPLTGLGISGFYALMDLFHFKLRRQSIAGRMEGRRGMLDRMEMQHVMDERLSVLFNFVAYDE